MSIEFNSGDMIAISGKHPVSWGIQAATLSLPNIGPLGRWGLSGISHVGIIAKVWDEPIVYESTSFDRPPCVRTGRQNPKGVQAHYVSDVLDAGGDVWHYPVKRPLYLQEEERLLEVLEACLGREYDFFGAARSGGGVVKWALSSMFAAERLGSLFCSELVAHAWCQIGILQCRNSGAFNPVRLARHAVRSGICHPGRLVS